MSVEMVGVFRQAVTRRTCFRVRRLSAACGVASSLPPDSSHFMPARHSPFSTCSLRLPVADERTEAGSSDHFAFLSRMHTRTHAHPAQTSSPASASLSHPPFRVTDVVCERSKQDRVPDSAFAKGSVFGHCRLHHSAANHSTVSMHLPCFATVIGVFHAPVATRNASQQDCTWPWIDGEGR
jgi:hypothetical protein